MISKIVYRISGDIAQSVHRATQVTVGRYRYISRSAHDQMTAFESADAMAAKSISINPARSYSPYIRGPDFGPKFAHITRSAHPPERDRTEAALTDIARRLGPGVGELVRLSPSLTNRLVYCQKEKWLIRFGQRGSGTFADHSTQVIEIDHLGKLFPKVVVRSLAHETAHATQLPVYIRRPRRHESFHDWAVEHYDQFAAREGEALLATALTRHEIRLNGGDCPAPVDSASSDRIFGGLVDGEVDLDTAIYSYWGIYKDFHRSMPPHETNHEFYQRALSNKWHEYQSS